MCVCVCVCVYVYLQDRPHGGRTRPENRWQFIMRTRRLKKAILFYILLFFSFRFRPTDLHNPLFRTLLQVKYIHTHTLAGRLYIHRLVLAQPHAHTTHRFSLYIVYDYIIYTLRSSQPPTHRHVYSVYECFWLEIRRERSVWVARLCRETKTVSNPQRFIADTIAQYSLACV
jgi:hypothetical protein